MTSLRKVTRYGNDRWLWTWCRENKITRRYFKNEDVALAHYKEHREGIAALGSAWVSLPASVRTEMISGAARAAAAGVSVGVAIDFYISHVKGAAGSQSLKEAVPAFLAAKEAQGLRYRSLKALTSTTRLLLGAFTDSTVRSITPQNLEQFLATRKLSPRSQKGELTNLGTFFAWCISRDWMSKNPALLVPKPIWEKGDTIIFTPEEAQNLIDATWRVEPGMLGYIAIGLFAGLRTESEIGRLNRDDIDVDRGWITVKPDAKTRRRRLVTIRDPLAACLKIWLPLKEKPKPMNFDRRWKRVRVAAGYGEKWPQNVMRHSFVSYLYPVSGEQATTDQSGHSATVLHSTYRGLVDRETAERFWSIRPKSAV